MKALIYLMKTNIINYFKQLKKKPAKAIGPIAMVVFMITMFLSKNDTSKTLDIDIFISLFLLITISAFIYSLYTGTKSINSKFNMADVNLIFVSPIKPQTVMIYGIIKKMSVELFAYFYIIYQIPNLTKSMDITIGQTVSVIIIFIIMQIVFCNIVKLLVFVLNSKYPLLGRIIRLTIKIVGAVLCVAAVLIFLKGRPITFVKELYSSIGQDSWIKFIPIFGWVREMVYQSLTTINMTFFLYLAMIIFLSVLLVYITYCIEIDFYEDMLSSAEANEVIKKAKNREQVTTESNKNNRLFKAFRKVQLKLDNKYKAEVLFYKHLNEYSKRSFLFFINTYSIILLLVSLTLGIFAKGVEIKLVYMIFCGLLFFGAGLAGKIYYEITNPLIFMIPDSPQKKLFYGTASSLIKLVSDSIILFIPFGILSGVSIIEMFLCCISYVLLGAMFSYSGLVGFRISNYFGFTDQISQGVFFMFFQMFLLVPAAIMVITLGVATEFSGYAIYLAMIAYTSVLTVIFSFGAVGIFDNMEL